MRNLPHANFHIPGPNQNRQRSIDQLDRGEHDFHEARERFELEEIIWETSNIVKSLTKQGQRFLQSEIHPSTNTEAILLAHEHGSSIRTALALFPRIRQLVDRWSAKHAPIDGLEKLNESEKELRSYWDEVRAKWLIPNSETLRQSERDLVEGRFRVL